MSHLRDYYDNLTKFESGDGDGLGDRLNGPVIANPDGASLVTEGGSIETGVIKITLPKSWSDTMLQIRALIYLYDQTEANQSVDLVIGGYNASSTNAWAGPSAEISAGDGPLRVRYGHDGSKCCILIGETSTVWTHTQIAVTDVLVGYDGVDDWDNGWDISIESDISAVTVSQDIETKEQTQVDLDALEARVNGPRVINPDGATEIVAGAKTGALVIELPKSWSSNMLLINLSIFEYLQDGATQNSQLLIAGYNYSSSWFSEQASIVSGDVNRRVRWGHNGTKCVIVIDDVADTWTHPQVGVTDVLVGYGASDGWESGWSINFETDISGITFTADETTTNAGLDLVALNERINGPRIVNPEGGHIKAPAANVTGALVIELPKSWSDTMIKMNLSIYDYIEGGATQNSQIEINGYNSTYSTQWRSEQANILSGDVNRRVRFGHNGTKCVIVIDDIGDTWNYPQITISDVLIGHLNLEGWESGWNLSFETDISGITFTADETTTNAGVDVSLLNDRVNGPRVINPAGAVYTTTTANVTGALVIELPKSWSNTMIKMNLSIYEYLETGATQNSQIEINGYNNTSGTTWVSEQVSILSGDINRRVRWGHNGTKCVIVIDDVADVWKYPQIAVSDVIVGYTNKTGWESGWNITFETDISGITFTADETTTNAGLDLATLNNRVNGPRVINPDGAVYINPPASSSTVTGALVIELPKSWSDTMIEMNVSIYEYNAAGATQNSKLAINGYNADGSTSWYSEQVSILSGDVNRRVRWGHNGTKCVIVIDDVADTWEYPQVAVNDVLVGYLNIDGWDTGWNLSFETDISGITFTADETSNNAGVDVSLLHERLNGPRVLNPDGGTFINTVDQTGALVIELPKSWSDTMLTFDVSIFDCIPAGGTNNSQLRIGGWNYSGNSQWLTEQADIISGNINRRVRWGHNGSKCAIVIGDVGDTWSKPQVAITNVFAARDNTDDWDTGWSISFETDISSITTTADETTTNALVDVAALNNRLNGPLIINPDGGAYIVNSNVTGALVIELPRSWTSTKLKVDVSIYEHDAAGSTKDSQLTISGYNHSGSWYSEQADIISGNVDRRVRWGHNGTNCVLVIEDVTYAWESPNVAITNVLAGGYDTEGYDKGWNITFETDLSGITFTADETAQVISSQLTDLINENSGIWITGALATSSGTTNGNGDLVSMTATRNDQVEWVNKPLSGTQYSYTPGSYGTHMNLHTPPNWLAKLATGSTEGVLIDATLAEPVYMEKIGINTEQYAAPTYYYRAAHARLKLYNGTTEVYNEPVGASSTISTTPNQYIGVKCDRIRLSFETDSNDSHTQIFLLMQFKKFVTLT